MPPNLTEGETIIFEGHPSWRSTLVYYIQGLVATIVVAVIASLAGLSTVGVVLIVAAGLGLTILIGFVRRMATTYAITSKRLWIKRGLLSRKVQETRLIRVQNVNTEQSFLERILGIGKVDFDTAGSDDSDFTFFGVVDPEGIQRQADHATHEAQQADPAFPSTGI